MLSTHKTSIASLVFVLSIIGIEASESSTGGVVKETEFDYRIVDSVVYSVGIVRSELLRLLGNENEMAQKQRTVYYGIKFLGEIRCVEAVPLLCERLLFRQWVERANAPCGPSIEFPAYNALVRIGQPSVAGLLRKIAETETSKKYRQVALEIIVKIIGKENVTAEIENFRVKKGEPNAESQQKRLNDFRRQWFPDENQADNGEDKKDAPQITPADGPL